MFLPMKRNVIKMSKRPINEILQHRGQVRPIEYKSKEVQHSKHKKENVYKTRSQLLQEFLKKNIGPLTLKNSKFLNAQVKIHKRRKEEANKRHKLVVINQPTRTIFKPKSPPKTKAGPSKPKSPPKTKAKCITPRCKALKMKNQKICDAKIKNGGNFCKRHRKK